jgi:hypothetical protein
MGRFDALTNLEEKDSKTSLLANQQTSKPAKKQTSLPVNEQTSKEVSQQTSKVVNQHTNKGVNQQTSKKVTEQTRTIALTTKEKKKYGTYLREDSIIEINVRCAQTNRDAHEILQEAVDSYFTSLKR